MIGAETASASLVQRRAVFGWCRLALVIVFLAWFLQFYRDGFAFTSVLMFNEHRAKTRIDSLRDTPIFIHPGPGYDGMFYAQLALDPLVRDPSIDLALDSAPFRARRILFSWTAWALGLGQPAWILIAYCVQNVLFWLMLAYWLYARTSQDNAREFAEWVACLFAPGMLDSTRMALLDGPSLLVVALGVAAVERGRLWTGSIILGAAGLARETNLLTGTVILPRHWTPRAVARAVGAGCLILLPTLIWLDYLRSIYRSTVTQSLDQLSAPFAAFLDAWQSIAPSARGAGLVGLESLALLALIGVTAQATWIICRSFHDWRNPWWRLGIVFVGLMMLVKGEIWLGAYLRVLLPLTLAFNLLLPRNQWFWPAFVLGNLGLSGSLWRLLTTGS